MQVFFVVDSLDNLDEKIVMIENCFNTDIRFFVKTDLYTQICTNASLLERLAGVYESNEVKKIDEYIKSNRYEADNVVLFYSSAKVTQEMIKEVIKKIKYGYDTISFTKSRNKIANFFLSLYVKIGKFIFGCEDSLCYHKFMFMSKKVVEYLIATKFNNHIVKFENSVQIELIDKGVIKTMKEKTNVASYNIWNVIFLLSLIIFYVVAEVFFDLRFYMYFGFVVFIIMSILLGVMLAIHNIFEIRYKRK